MIGGLLIVGVGWVLGQPRRIEPIRVEKKVALVIGNAAYQRGALKNPGNDAKAMGEALRRLGFEVIEGRDLSLKAMEQTIDQFAARLSRGDLGLFYYSGHGQQIQLENYLLPVDFGAPQQEADVKYAAYPATRVREKMEESGARLRILILDACRDNPYRGTRSGVGGLAAMNSRAEGTLIAFATGDNNVADDNLAGSNGLFTQHLLKALETPGVGLKSLFGQVKESVYVASEKRQNPFTYDNVVGDYILYDPAAEVEALRRQRAADEAELVALRAQRETRTKAEQEALARRIAEMEERRRRAQEEENRLAAEARRRAEEEAEKARRRAEHEAERRQEAERLAKLKGELEAERLAAGASGAGLTLEQARARVAQLTAQMAAVEARVRSIAPVAPVAPVKDTFETTAAFRERQQRHEAELAQREARVKEEVRAQASGLEKELEQLRSRKYRVAARLVFKSYDADRRLLTIVGPEKREYRAVVEPEQARLLHARLAEAVVEGPYSTAGELRGLSVRLTGGNWAIDLFPPYRVNPKDGLTYVWIPPGTFRMGCSEGDGECESDEKPALVVTVAKGYWMGETEVTQAAWRRVTGKAPSHFKGDDLPVENITMEEARSYCVAVGGRLPTEKEWEYAARAGNTSARYGDVKEVAWTDKTSEGQPHPVKQKSPNAWGLYDVLGNVLEWVEGDQNLRGGSWVNGPRIARVSYRGWIERGNRDNVIGVRCLRE
jgi:formylglycine-generating enzyme required for sulfatase activity